MAELNDGEQTEATGTELTPEFEVVMAQLRGRVTDNKAAAISALLFAEMGENIEIEVIRLDRVFGWVCAEIDRLDPSAGARMMVALKEVRKELDGQGYWLMDDEEAESE